MYWARKPCEPGVHLICSKIMSRDRYLSIMKFPILLEVKGVKKNEPNTRLDNFCNVLAAIAIRKVDAGEYCAIDKAIVLYKGRLGFRQFALAQKTRFGAKMSILCNSEREWFGYNNNFCI